MPKIAAATALHQIRIGLVAVVALASTGVQAEGQSVVPGWLAGCWRMERGAMITEEQWMTPRGGVMLGISRATRRDTVVSEEFLRLSVRGDTIVYWALPTRQTASEFRTRSATDQEITFENPAHDFPQRIRYRRAGADSLLAQIEGERGGQTRTITFPYRRASCPGSPGR
jgi:hypothetical protein